MLTDVIKGIKSWGYSINENLAGAQEENEMAANGQLNWANINNAACQFAMGFQSESDCNRFYAPLDSRTWGSTVSYAESHDEQRMAYKQNQWGVAGVKGNEAVSMRRLGSVAAQMLLAPGAHMIWQFGELGDDTNTKNADGGNNTDPKPVHWNYLDSPDRAGLHNSYRELISLRKLNPELFTQGNTYTMSCSGSNWANGRFIYSSAGTKELICVINPLTTTKTFTGVTFKSTDNAAYKIVSQSFESPVAFDASAGSVTLEGGAYVVLANDNVSGIDGIVSDMTAAPRAIGGVGEIIIVGDYNNACVYTLDGRMTGSLNVPAGLYIVNVDGVATKVLVK